MCYQQSLSATGSRGGSSPLMVDTCAGRAESCRLWGTMQPWDHLPCARETKACHGENKRSQLPAVCQTPPERQHKAPSLQKAPSLAHPANCLVDGGGARQQAGAVDHGSTRAAAAPPAAKLDGQRGVLVVPDLQQHIQEHGAAAARGGGSATGREASEMGEQTHGCLMRGTTCKEPPRPHLSTSTV